MKTFTLIEKALAETAGSTFEVLPAASACMANPDADPRWAHLCVAEETGFVAVFYPDLDSMFSSHGDTPADAVDALAANLVNHGVVDDAVDA